MKGLLANMWDNKESVVGGLFDMFNQTGMKKGVDNRVQGLIDMGVPEALFTKAPATTEANLGRSTANAIRNLPAQIPDLAKGIIDVAYNPIDTAKDLGNLAEGAATNFSDMFYDTLTPKKYEAAFKEVRDRGRTDQSFKNEANASAIGQSILEGASTEQGRRDFAQGNSLDLLIGGGYAATKIPKLAAMNQNLSNPISVGLSIKDVSNNNPFVDAAGTFSKAEKTLMDMKQGSMGTNEIIPYLQGRGILNSEIQDLKLDRYVEDTTGKTVTKEGLLDHISNNRTSLSSTSLLSPTNVGTNPNNITQNTVFISDPHEAYAHIGEGRYFENEETPDGTLSVLANPEEILSISENLDDAMTGSLEVNAETTINGRSANDTEWREHYPFNYSTDERVFSKGVAQGNAQRSDSRMATAMLQMHYQKPEEYPMTRGLQAFENQDIINSLNSANRQDQPNIKELTDKNFTLLKELKTLNGNGVEEWDQSFSKNFALTRETGEQLKTMDEALDFDDALAALAEQEYLKSPMFEQKIEVTPMPEYDGAETEFEYTVIGNDETGYFVYDPQGETIADSVDLPRAQAMLNTDARERGFLETIGSEGDDMGKTGTSRYHGYLSDADKQYVDSYSEELIQLVPNTNKKSKYYEGAAMGGEGYQYDAGHYENNPNTLISYRKVIVPPQAITSTDGANIDTGAYKIVEMQSDWIQDGRQFGFTQDEYKDIGTKLKEDRKNMSYYDKALNVFEDSMDISYEDGAIDMAWGALQDVPNYIHKQAFIASLKKTANKGIVNQSFITKDSEQRFELAAKQIEKDVNADWVNSTYNPDSDQFDMDEYYGVGGHKDVLDYVDKQYDVKAEKIGQWEDHTPSPRNPLKDKDTYITTGLQDAIQKAHKKGLKLVTWSSGSQILDRWNKTRQLNEKGNIRYKELYGNIYDKKLPKAARKLLEKYKGNKLQEIEIDGEMNFAIEITDEMIKNMKKEFPNLPEDSKVLPMPQYGKANQITGGLLQTDIAQPQLKGLIA